MYKKMTYQAQNIWENTEEKMSFNTEYLLKMCSCNNQSSVPLDVIYLGSQNQKKKIKMLEKCALQMKNWHWTADSRDLL